ncbi:hypothetical protein DITRI_Ditri01bG0015700 [Diplodiscus trichospermus]
MIVVQLENLKVQYGDWTIEHILREANGIADGLAKSGVHSSNDMVLFFKLGKIPSCSLKSFEQLPGFGFDSVQCSVSYLASLFAEHVFHGASVRVAGGFGDVSSCWDCSLGPFLIVSAVFISKNL